MSLPSHPLPARRIQFQNAQGIQLEARLDSPADGRIRAYAIFAHCFTCSKDLGATRRISRAMTAQGIGVLRFDFTGLGHSEGDFSQTGFASNLEDLVAAAEWLEENLEAPELLVGHSLGGAAVLFAASRIPTVKAVATVAAPYSPDHVTHLLGPAKETLKKQESAEVSIGGRPFQIGRTFLEQLEGVDAASTIKNLKKPLLVLHAPFDKIVGIENAEQIYKAAHHPKSYISLDGADHLLSRAEDADYAGLVIASWAARYISQPEISELSAHKQVAVRTGRTFTTEIRAGRHGLLADEPIKVGGRDLGPGPYEYLLAGLGACTGMTLRMYADRKGWPLESATVHLEHDRVYEQDQEDMEDGNKGKRLDRIRKWIELEGDLDETQRARLMEIADRCPVHRTLSGPILLESVEHRD